MTEIIHDGKVTCPNCDQIIEVKRKGGGGCDAAKHWKQLPKKHIAMLAVWLSDPNMLRTWSTKEELRRDFAESGLHISEDAINARISELLALGLVKFDKHIKARPDFTVEKPHYMLNTTQTILVLNNNGRLEPMEIVQ